MIGAIGQVSNQPLTTGVDNPLSTQAQAPLSIVEQGMLLRAQDGKTSSGEVNGPQIITRPDGIKTDAFGVKMTGNEPAYDPERWNWGPRDSIQQYNNCYAYAVDDLKSDRTSKPQPGERAGNSYGFNAGNRIDTARLQKAIEADGRGGKITFLGSTPESTLAAPKGTYIVALVVDRSDKVQDYHWYRHDSDGSWSGKGGGGPATNLDASGKLILDPRTANRDYGPMKEGYLHYAEFVGYYAVKVGTEVGSR